MVRIPRPVGAAPAVRRGASPWADTTAWREAALAAGARLSRIQWTLPYVGFLLYMFVIVTYWLNLATVAIGLAIFGLLMQGTLRLPALVGWFALFIVWAAVGYAQTQYPEVVSEALLARAKLGVVMLIAVNAMLTRAQVRFALLFFLGAFAIFPARVTLILYVLGHRHFGRAIGPYTYSNPNDLAAVCLLATAVALALFATEPKNSLTRKAALVAGGTTVLITLMTQSRGAFLGLVIMLAPYVIARVRRQPKSLVGFAVMAAIVLALAPAGVWERVGALKNVTSGTANMRAIDAEGSAESRYEIIQTALRIIADHPVAGVGVGSYPYANAAYSPELGELDTHNTYLNLAAETGIPGVLIFIGLVASTLLHARKSRRIAGTLLVEQSQQLRCLELGLIGFLVAGIFGSYSYLNFPYLYIGMLYCASEVLRNDARKVRAPLQASAGRQDRRLLAPQRG
jgi:putative inorganic carbon (HCO3(-)) transporter